MIDIWPDTDRKSVWNFFFPLYLTKSARLSRKKSVFILNYLPMYWIQSMPKKLNHSWYAWSIWCIGIPGYNNWSWESDDTTLTEYICQNTSKCVRKKAWILMMYQKRGISWICIRPFSVRYSSKKMRQKILWHIIVRGALFYVYCIHCPWYKCISRKKQNMSFLLRPETLWEMNTICLSKDLILMVVVSGSCFIDKNTVHFQSTNKP